VALVDNFYETLLHFYLIFLLKI